MTSSLDKDTQKQESLKKSGVRAPSSITELIRTTLLAQLGDNKQKGIRIKNTTGYLGFYANKGAVELTYVFQTDTGPRASRQFTVPKSGPIMAKGNKPDAPWESERTEELLEVLNQFAISIRAAAETKSAPDGASRVARPTTATTEKGRLAEFAIRCKKDIPRLDRQREKALFEEYRIRKDRIIRSILSTIEGRIAIGTAMLPYQAIDEEFKDIEKSTRLYQYYSSISSEHPNMLEKKLAHTETLESLLDEYRQTLDLSRSEKDIEVSFDIHFSRLADAILIAIKQNKDIEVLLRLFMQLDPGHALLKALSKNLPTDNQRNLDLACTERIHQNIVSAHLIVVANAAKEFVSRGSPTDTCIALGTKGMCRAVDTFDHRTGEIFNRYCFNFTWSAIDRGLALMSEERNLVQKDRQSLKKIKRVIPKVMAIRGHLDIDLLAQYTELAKETVENLLKFLKSQPRLISMDASFGEDDERTLADTLGHEETPESQLMAKESDLEFERILKEAGLTERQRMFFYEHYIVGRNNEDIGKEHGLTRERVRQILKEILLKIKRSLGINTPNLKD